MDSNAILAILFWIMCWLFFYVFAFDRSILVKLHSLMTFRAVEQWDMLQNENFIAKCRIGMFTSAVGGTILTVVLIRKLIFGAD